MTRILGGRWKGRRLKVPTRGTRPSTGKLREALFSSLGRRVVGAEIFDLFAGSGALGLEALSRGAARATFVENQPTALRALGENLRALGLTQPEASVRRLDAWRWLADRESEPPSDAIALLDPPYDASLAQQLLPAGLRLLECGRLGVFCLEHPSEADLPELSPVVGVSQRTRRHGRGAFTLLERSLP